MKAIRMMYIACITIIGAPLYLAFVLAVYIWSIFDWRRTFGTWDGAFSSIGAFLEGVKCGLKFNWHWAKTGEADWTYLM